ncbi:ankyrin repeat protein [Histoplasma capsulatum var. duboisii H88]|nr:ankyrin repeat protein [Histoplasma capsulatum var. duboisii H88]
MATQLRTHDDYTVGWVCALPKELTAAAAMLDEIHEELPKHPNDHNAYTLGRVGVHNIAIACLPKGEIGSNNAATVATWMTSTFPSIKFGLMVGIGGGVPKSVRLGDVVVSTPTDEFSGVVQWNFGKTQQEGFKRTGALNRPPTELLTALTKLEREHEMKGSKIPHYLDELKDNWPRLAPRYARSESLRDVLFRASCRHVEKPDTCDTSTEESQENDYEEEEEGEGDPCSHCDPGGIIRRKPRDMRVHYGLIASGNQVIKDALVRDDINKRLGGKVLCFEMEAAGLMNSFPCLVIRGICDYADAHKNKNWQEHAAAVAAAFAKELLSWVPTQEVEKMPTIKSQLEGVINIVNQLHSHQQNQEHQTISEWLTPMNYAPQQNDLISQRQECTGEWLLRSDKFQQWVREPKQTLFCPGIPGAGKTIITSIVVHDLHRRFQNDPSVGIAYLYCNFKQQQEQKPADLIASLLKQLLQGQPSVVEVVKDLYNRHKRVNTRPSLDELRSSLQQIAASYQRTFIVIDALDECRASPDGREMFLQEIFNLQTNTNASIFATSRFIQEIEGKFDGSIRLEIRANATDVQKYLDERLRNCSTLISEDKSLQEEIKTKIAKAVDGMFLLARLYVDSLAFKTNKKAIKQALQEIEATSNAPNDSEKFIALDTAYKHAMERIRSQPPDYQDLAMRALQWIVCAKSQLTSMELQHALAIEPNTSELDIDNVAPIQLIVSVCAGLIIAGDEGGIIHLIHYTTQKFLERSWESWFPNAHTDIAKTCVTYLSFKVFETGYCLTKDALTERLQLYPFYSYAARNWGYHVRESSIQEESLILDFLHGSAKVSACYQIMVYNGCSPGAMKIAGMHLAVYLELKKCISALLKGNANIETKDQFEQTPLLWAAILGFEQVVKLLLERNANIEAKSVNGKTPLSYAARLGYKQIVKLLLERNANIEAKSVNGKTPLSYAAENGHEQIVKLLLERNANIEIKDEHEYTPLSSAARLGYKQIVKLLLERNANIETKDQYAETPLSHAAFYGRKQVVKLLLERNANIETKDQYAQTPLSQAACSGRKQVVKLLLKRNANIEVKDEDGQTPLSWAAFYGHKQTVKLLLERNANIEIKDKDGRTPLSWAAEKGHGQVVKLLLERNANIEVKDKNGQTPLSWAAYNGHEQVVKLLQKASYSQPPVDFNISSLNI